MTITLTLTCDEKERLVEWAARKNQSLDETVSDIVASQVEKLALDTPLAPTSNGDETQTAYEVSLLRTRNRTPEELAETRSRMMRGTPPPLLLPPGKTLEDVISGQWPGNETDEEIIAALKEMS